MVMNSEPRQPNGHLYAPHVPPQPPQPAGEAMRSMSFRVTIKSFGRGDHAHIAQVSAFLWRHLHRAFGADRVTLYSNDLGRRFFYDSTDEVEAEEILP